jgi:hypothetical protein
VTEQVVRGKLVTYPKLLAEAEIGGTPFSAIKRVTRKNAECTYYLGNLFYIPSFGEQALAMAFWMNGKARLKKRARARPLLRSDPRGTPSPSSHDLKPFWYKRGYAPLDAAR